MKFSARADKLIRRWMIPVLSVLSIIWILIRVIPKPQRATYPCMRVAFPFATTLIIYVTGLLASAVVFKKAFRKIAESRYFLAGFLVVVGIGFGVLTMVSGNKDAFAGETVDMDYEDPLGPNVPIGEAKGIMPGRVAWIHNPNATNEECIPWDWGDGYFLDKNADQDVVDSMLIKGLLEVTGEDVLENAWDSIFTYFNSTHDKGKIGYSEGEKIFIKINAVHAWTTNNDLSIKNDGNYGNVDTSPQVILAVLRQLVYKAGVPEDAIYIGDPYTQIFKHLYEKLSAEFPDIHYMSKSDVDLREKLQFTNTDSLLHSEKGTIMEASCNTFFDCIVNADYLLNLPAMKGHRWGGVTFFAKNHFGSNTTDGAWRMHTGLHKTTKDGPVRGEYKSYRVMVDLMAYEHLGGKTLIYIGDLLWGTSYEHDPPVKFQSAPFNNDWSSSILVSMDPVAISSVALDILQEEFQVETTFPYPPRYTYVRFPAVDDYLHQAASSEWWPDSIVYDPENDGTPIESLGVHEHWNNATDKKYSRNLGTGDGIELVYDYTEQEEVIDPTSIETLHAENLELKAYLSQGNSTLNLEFNRELRGAASVRIYNVSGQLVQQTSLEYVGANLVNQIALDPVYPGYYVVNVQSVGIFLSQPIFIQ